MNWTVWAPPLVVLSALLTAVLIFFLPEAASRRRTALNLIGASVHVLIVVSMMVGVDAGTTFHMAIPLLPGMDLVLRADLLSLLFASLSAGLWFLTTLYAVGYLEASPNRSRFFGFFSLCIAATSGIALAGNLLTLLIFYELLTLATYPLVTHRGTRKSLQAGVVYLAYTLTGGTVLLLGIVWLRSLAGPLEFTEPTGLASLLPEHRAELIAIFWLLIGGFGVKAALVPLHGWLPQAMVAPAPVSALLHAVAVVKAGIFGIVRVVHDVYGLALAEALGVLSGLAAIAAVTIVYGSLRALYQDDLKRRLAFSTVSQLSYIALGTALFGPLATVGGLVHLVHQGLMKITMFFCAGNVAETLGIHRISEMDGVGRRMPLTMVAFTIAALAMIGVPPLIGYISKWYLVGGALEIGAEWVAWLLAASSLLNAAYFLPILQRSWFARQTSPWPQDHGRYWILETHWMLLVPPLATALLTILGGVLASAWFSPLTWAEMIAVLEYAR